MKILKLICPSCGDQKGYSFGTGDCGCDVGCKWVTKDTFQGLFPKRSLVAWNPPKFILTPKVAIVKRVLNYNQIDPQFPTFITCMEDARGIKDSIVHYVRLKIHDRDWAKQDLGEVVRQLRSENNTMELLRWEYLWVFKTVL